MGNMSKRQQPEKGQITAEGHRYGYSTQLENPAPRGGPQLAPKQKCVLVQ